MKRIEFSRLVRAAFTCRGFFGPESGKQTWNDAGWVAPMFERLMKALNQCRYEDDGYGWQSWPSLWIELPLEDMSDLKAMFPDIPDTPDFRLVALSREHRSVFPELDEGDLIDDEVRDGKSAITTTLRWIQIQFGVLDGDELHISLQPIHAKLYFNLKNRNLAASGDGDGEERRRAIARLIEWIADRAEKEIAECLRDAEGYQRRLEGSVPREERFGRIQRVDLWRHAPGLDHPLCVALSATENLFAGAQPDDESDRCLIRRLSYEEAAEFLRIEAELREDRMREMAPVQEMTAGKFLEYCAICYGAVGPVDAKSIHRSPRDLYWLNADKRHDGLLDIDQESAEAFRDWRQKPGGGHPWEIAAGFHGYMRIDLIPIESRGGFILMLRCFATIRIAEAAKMAIALKRAGLPVVLQNSESIARSVRGEDWVGVQPESYSAPNTHLFPEAGQIADIMWWNDLAGLSAADKVELYPFDVFEAALGADAKAVEHRQKGDA